MADSRNWFNRFAKRKDTEKTSEPVWEFDPLPLIPDQQLQRENNALVSIDHTAGGDLIQTEQFDTDEEQRRDDLPFSAERVGRLTALRFYLENCLFDFRDATSKAVAREYELGNHFNFVPVILALGIGAYYAASSEPSLIASALTLVFLAAILSRTQTRGLIFKICISASLFISGLAVAKIQMDSAVMPIPRSELTGHIEGVVVAVDQNRRGAPRYLVEPASIEGLNADELPKLVRISAAKRHLALSPGDGITGLARLQPFSGPAYPGSYDFSFSAYMRGLGMAGFFMGVPEKVPLGPTHNWLSQADLKLQAFRGYLSARIRAGLPGEAGDIATALITGDRSGLSEETQESLRRSGLAHILAISGLHMALVTLTVIWLVRLILVLVPNLADQYPIKKWAIAAGFMTATLYLFISGASVATQRAWLMISVMLAASFMDRRALTMRSVTIAALIILLVSPASLFEPGFQMSFAAVAALVVIYQDWTRLNRKRRANFSEVKRGWFRQILGYFTGLSATSLIAGFATALIAMAHFHRVAPMGLISNLVAMPLVSLFVMPLSLLSMFLMPYGFEELALAPLGKSIDAVVDVADWVNSYEFDFETGHRPSIFLFLSSAFLVLSCFLRTRLRLLSILPLIAMLTLIGRQEPLPDLLIGQNGRSIAVRTALISSTTKNENESGLALLYPRTGAFITDIWRKAFLPNQSFDALPDPIACTKERCDFDLAGRAVKVIFDPDLLAEACNSADLLIAPRLWWVNCKGRKPALIINRTDLEGNGAYQLTVADGGFLVKTAWPITDNFHKRRVWQQRFNVISRKYPRWIPFEQGPPRRRNASLSTSDDEFSE